MLYQVQFQDYDSEWVNLANPTDTIQEALAIVQGALAFEAKGLAIHTEITATYAYRIATAVK